MAFDPVSMGVEVAAPIIGAGLGLIFSNGDKKKAEALEQQALQQYGEVSLPALKAVQAQLVSTGDWDRMPSDFGNRNPRDAAIQSLISSGLHGGNDAQSNLAMEQARIAAANQEASGRASVRQEAQRRGMGGAGEFLGQLSAQQAGAQSAHLADMQAAASAQQRALQELQQGGTMAANAETADYNQASNSARERAAIAQYNSTLGMQSQMANNALLQQGYTDQMQLAGARAGAYLTAAQQRRNNAAQTRATWAGIGQGVQGALANAPGAMGAQAQPQQRQQQQTPYSPYGYPYPGAY